MLKIKDIVNHLEDYAPPAYQESYDNAGLIVGDASNEVKGILITLDSTEEVIDEAIEKGCNLVVAHHPIVFSGLKKITGRNYVERTIIKAIKNDIAIFAAHTNLDSVKNGVNNRICDLIGLQNRRILAPKKGLLKNLTVFVPHEDADRLREALNNAGAGQLGDYKNCSFQSEGLGTFEPNENANPYIGKSGKLERVKETRIELIFPAYLEGEIIRAMYETHPYEEVAHYIHALENTFEEVGAGMIGELNTEMHPDQFFAHLKKTMNLNVIRHTKLIGGKIKKVALCGGAGSFLLGNAINKNADIFITGDFKYHEFFDAEDKILIADIGHYESEVFTKDLFLEILREKFTSIAIVCSHLNTNPIFYS